MNKFLLRNQTNEIGYYIFLLFPFIQQRSYQETPFIAGFYLIYTLVASIMMFGVVAPYIGRIYKRNTIIYVITAFIGAYFIATLFSSTKGAIRSTYTVFGFYSLSLFIFYEAKHSLQKILSALSYIYGFFIYANFITDILFPSGLYTVTVSSHHSAHLLGDDNAIIYVVLPGLACMICNSLQKYRKITPFVWVALLMSIYTLVSIWSVSAFLCIILFALIIFYEVRFRPIHPYLLLMSVFLMVFISIFGLNNEFIGGFIEKSLDKDITISGRTVLWYKSLEMISEKPILGWGGYFMNGKFDLGPTISYPCHTPYLQMLIDGGVILFSIFLVLTFLIYKEAQRYKIASSYVLIACLTCMLVNYITEWSQHYHYFIICLLISNLRYFRKDSFSDKYSYRKKREIKKSVGLRYGVA